MFTLTVDEDIELRLHDIYQVEAFYNLIVANRRHIGQYMDWVENHQEVEDTHNYILSERKSFAERKGVATRIYYQGQVAGSVAISIANDSLRLGEVGYWLGEAFTGKGIATRAARAMVDYGFATLGLHKIIIRVMTTNEKSRAIPKRLGFKHQGIDVHGILHYGTYYDFDVYYALEDDWTTTLPAPEFRYRVADNLELRVHEPRHAEDLYALTDANRAYLRQWLPWLDTTTSVDDTRSFIKGALRQYGNHDGLQLGIWSDGDLCGAIGYHYWDFSNKKTEIGYWLSESHTGQGIMTRCVRALIDYAFNVLQLHRIEIPCATDNRRSCAIPQRLGFTHEGVVRQAEWLYDHYVDWNLYALLAHEWQRMSDG